MCEQEKQGGARQDKGVEVRHHAVLAEERAEVSARVYRHANHLEGIRRTGVFGWTRAGLTPDGSPLVLGDTGTQEIYALDVELP